MSTCWFAHRCKAVLSIEHDPFWYEVVKQHLMQQKLNNVEYLLRNTSAYCELETLPNHWQQVDFDFVLVDGICRGACVSAALDRVKHGGYIYLDNSDRAHTDYQRARELLCEAASSHGTQVTYYTDFVPSSFIVTQGMLVQL